MADRWDDGMSIDEGIDEAIATLLGIGEPVPAEVLWEMLEPRCSREEFTERLESDRRVRLTAEGWAELCSADVIHRPRPGTRRAGPSIVDRLVDVLESHGEPMPFSDLSRSVDHRLSAQRLKSRISADKRMMRTDRDTYGLAEWGHEPYDSLVGLIGRSIERHGGVASISEIIADLEDRFTVNAQSIRTFAQTDAFVKVGRGRLRVRAQEEYVEEQEGPTSGSKDCLVIDGRWAYRITLDERMLAGFSAPLPRGFGLALGVRRNSYRQLAAMGGHRLGVSRKSLSESLGRLRPVAEWLGLEAGDLLFVIVPAHPADEIEFRARRFEDLAEMEEDRRVAAILGIEGSLDTESAAAAIGMPPRSSAAAIVATLNSRGEADLARDLASILLKPDSDHGVDADDIAAALGW